MAVRHLLSSLLLGLLLVGCTPTESQDTSADTQSADAVAATQQLEIPYEKFVLDNGLTLIVHEDHKAPVVAVNVWYHVGSKNEKPGKTGFAHLFEHLMFNGSEHYNKDYFKAFDNVGATGMNGTTNHDRTNYFEVVPKTALDMALWMESDRMGFMVDAIDQAKLDEQRGVVQNEKRQGANQPYGTVWPTIMENVYPEGHPYSWSVIGSMDDLNAASLEDVKEWFNTYYGAANAVLVVAGDVETQKVVEKVKKYFGEIPAGPPVSYLETWIAKRNSPHRLIMQDRVPQARLYMVWNVPGYGSAESDYLYFAADVLAGGKSSRLYERLVFDEQLATSVNAYVDQMEIGGLFVIQATAVPGQDLAEIETIIKEELQKFLQEGPTREEMQQMKTSSRASFVRGMESIGGFGGKSSILARNEVFLNDPGAWKESYLRLAKADPEDLRNAAREWLSSGTFYLEVHPYPKYSASETSVDRSHVPEVNEFPEGDFPEAEQFTLSNGLNVYLIERHTIPVVEFHLVVGAGYAADGDTPGIAKLTADALMAGTGQLGALEISEREAALGAQLGASAGVDFSTVYLSALKSKLEPSLDLFADVALDPTFPKENVEKLRKKQLAAIQREMVTPIRMALRVVPGLLYGKQHPYGTPLTGSGTLAAVEGLTAADLEQFHNTWYKPGNATLFVVGDTTVEQIKPKLETLFSGWQAGDVPAHDIAKVQQQAKPAVYILDRPGSIQSIIFAAKLLPGRDNPKEFALQAANDVLGGGFTARLNMNLREDKHWAYGAGSFIVGTKAQRPLIAYAPVQSDKTAEAMREIAQEFRAYMGDKPATQAEVARIKDKSTLTLPGRWATTGAVMSDLSTRVLYGLPENYWDTYAETIRALDVDTVNAMADKYYQPEELVWVVIGDKDKIEAEIKKLDLGKIHYLDAKGNVIK